MSDFNLSQVEKRMKSALDAVHKEFSTIRTGRASPDMLASLMVDAYGTSMPLPQMAGVSLNDPRTLSVKVWDASLVASVEKAIRESALGLNPASNEGAVILVPIPQLTQERRRELVKLAGKYAEQGRVSVRNSRRDGIEDVRARQKQGSLSEDAMHTWAAEIQKLTDDTINEINRSLANKEKDISSI